MKVVSWLLTVAACALTAASIAGAQPQHTRRELVGFIRDPTGAAIENASVKIGATAVRSDARGAFQVWTGAIDTVTITVRHVGFLPVSALLTARDRAWDTVVVELERTAQSLGAVTVTGDKTRRALGLRDFEDRRALGNGVFLRRDEIEARNTTRASDLLLGKRGVTLVRLRNGFYGVRFVAHGGPRRTCAPSIWLDGVRARGMEIDDVPANTIEAMELYENFASTPSQFTPMGGEVSCGTIVIWTRIPGN